MANNWQQKANNLANEVRSLQGVLTTLRNDFNELQQQHDTLCQSFNDTVNALDDSLAEREAAEQVIERQADVIAGLEQHTAQAAAGYTEALNYRRKAHAQAVDALVQQRAEHLRTERGSLFIIFGLSASTLALAALNLYRHFGA